MDRRNNPLDIPSFLGGLFRLSRISFVPHLLVPHLLSHLLSRISSREMQQTNSPPSSGLVVRRIWMSLQPSVQVFGLRREMALMEYFRQRHRCSIYAMTIPQSPTLHFAEHSIVDLTGLILRSSCVTGWVLHDLPARHSGSPP